jgi:hypothetical protein
MPSEAPWKAKVQDILKVCQGEIKRTTEIGKKMLSASKTNSGLHAAYEELGQYVVNQIRAGKMDCDGEFVTNLMKTIEEYEKDLETIENEVNDIKASNDQEEN